MSRADVDLLMVVGLGIFENAIGGFVVLLQLLGEVEIREEQPGSGGRLALWNRGERRVFAPRDAGDNVDLFASAGHEHVHAAAAARLADGAEIPAELAVFAQAVGRADDQVIAFVALHVFEILDEDSFRGILAPARPRFSRDARATNSASCSAASSSRSTIRSPLAAD